MSGCLLLQSLPKIGRKSMNSLSTGYTAAVEESVGGMGLEQHPSFSDLRQCLGPKCRFGAAAASKYCPAACGRALARKSVKQRVSTCHHSYSVFADA